MDFAQAICSDPCFGEADFCTECMNARVTVSIYRLRFPATRSFANFSLAHTGFRLVIRPITADDSVSVPHSC